jgi:hypothetical protein
MSRSTPGIVWFCEQVSVFCLTTPQIGAHMNLSIICKHWLRGLCKRIQKCDYLHEYNLRRMPECSEYAQYAICANGDECLFLHLDPEVKRPSCPHYDRGFCPLGPHCALKHNKKERLCPFYLCGFCPEGRTCKNGAHARFPMELDKPEVWVEKSKEEKEAIQAEREAGLGPEEARWERAWPRTRSWTWRLLSSETVQDTRNFDDEQKEESLEELERCTTSASLPLLSVDTESQQHVSTSGLQGRGVMYGIPYGNVRLFL